MTEQRETGSAAAASLQQAIVAGSDVIERYLELLHEDLTFASALLTIALRGWFGAGPEHRDRTAFLVRIEAEQTGQGKVVQVDQMEQLIRALLGEGVISAEFGDVDIDGYYALLFEALLAEWQPDPAAIASLFAEARALAAHPPIDAELVNRLGELMVADTLTPADREWLEQTFAPDGSLAGIAAGGAFPDFFYGFLIRTVRPPALFRIADGLSRDGRDDLATTAMRQIIDSGDPAYVPFAALSLGKLLMRAHDGPGAIKSLRQARDSGHPDCAPEANYLLGAQSFTGGDLAAAIKAHKAAAESGHPDWAPRAYEALGEVFAKRGDIEAARRAYQQAMDSDHAQMAPVSAHNLGVVLQASGDTEGALAAYRRACESGNPDVVPQASLNLGSILGRTGDIDGARAAYERAAAAGSTDIVAKARLNLANLLQKQGRTREAKP